MKKIILVLILLLSLAPIAKVSAITPTPEAGHKCSNNQCLACMTNEPGCQPGVCTAFICENEDKEAPDAPVITNKEQLLEPQSGSFLNVKGVAEANTTVIALIDGEKKHEASVNTGGIFDISFNPYIGTNGVHKLELYLVDTSKNEGAKSEILNINFDLEKPEITFAEIPAFINFENILISGNTEAGSSVEVSKDEKIVYSTGADANGNFDLILTLNDGENKFAVKSIDKLGNEYSTDITLKYDKSQAVQLELGETTDNNVNIKFPEGIIKIEVYKNGSLIDTVDATGATEVNFDLKSHLDGLSSDFRFLGVDIAGNKTSPLIYSYQNSTKLMLLIFGVLLSLLIIIVIGYLIYRGKIKLSFLNRFNKEQIAMDLAEDKEVEEKTEKDNVVPANIRKEY